MDRLRVWAPRAARVDALIGSRRVAMSPGAGGWWETGGPDLQEGTRYGFSLDGGPPRPDPRSQSQPEGIDGPSQVVDHAAFAWTDSSWRGRPLAGAVLYELHTGTFSPEGTFDGAIKLLPHLVDLGVDGIELMPVAEFSGDRGWGYDGVDLFAPHHAYGGPEGLKRLVDACHAGGLAVVMDVVYNHLGPAGNYLAGFGPYFSPRHRTNWGDSVNFDGPGSLEVRRFMIDNALMWVRDYHVDGLRLDAVHAIADESALHILEELSREIQALAAHLGRSVLLIAESDLNDPRLVRSVDCGGYGLDACWADEWHHALHAALTGEQTGYYADFGTGDELAKALRQAWVHDGTWSPHRDRIHGRPPTGLTGDRFVVSTQNHDQVGNRAAGERLSMLTNCGRLKVAAALLLTSPFVPLLFQGEEWAASAPFLYFTDHRDPQLGEAVSRGRREEFSSFGWAPEDVPDPQESATFARSKLHWEERTEGRHKQMLEWYRLLIAVRKSTPALTDPRLERLQVTHDRDAGWFMLRRPGVLVAANLGAAPVDLPCSGRGRMLAASHPGIAVSGESVHLPSDTVVILGDQLLTGPRRSGARKRG